MMMSPHILVKKTNTIYEVSRMDNGKSEKNFTNFSNVEKMENYVIPEEFPEGPLGSPFREKEPVENKSTPWREDQRSYSSFNYEYKALHEDLPRQMEGAHLPHDDQKKSEQPPYDK
jgi:hypothetical protein